MRSRIALKLILTFNHAISSNINYLVFNFTLVIEYFKFGI